MNKIRSSVILGFTVFFLGHMNCQSQENKEKHFLFRSNKVQLSTFFVRVSPFTDFSKLNGQNVNIGVISGGFILNDKFGLSFFMATSPNVNLMEVPPYGSDEYNDWIEAGVKLYKLPENQNFVYVNFKHSGLRFDYMHKTENIVFFRGGLSFGFLGGLKISEDQTFLGLFNNDIYNEPVLTLEPDIGMGVNLLKWWRIHFDVGYRFLGADKRIMSAAEADSFTYSLTFAFGNFEK